MPNSFAYFMLLAWPFVTLVMFRKLPLERAIVWSILGGYLFLPPTAQFDLPLVPPLNKFSITSLSTVAVCTLVMRQPLRLWSDRLAINALTLLFLIGAVTTVLTNPDPIIYRILEDHAPIQFITHVQPGLSPRDALSMIVNQSIVLMPFLLARTHLASARGLRELILGLAIGGLVYSLPALLEVVFSPASNIMAYGFFQHDYAQTIRGDGFRPIVFLPHGLWLALFMASALMASAALARFEASDSKWLWVLSTFYLLLVLRACKSLAALANGLVMTPLILLFGRKFQVYAALLLAIVATTYPMLRNLELIPIDKITEIAVSVDADRGSSLAFRFDNEEILLERANEKPLFGWGGWGRNLILNPETLQIETVTDGNWILVFGVFGWMGYIAQMGLLSVPLWLLIRHNARRSISETSAYASALSVILAATMMDMLLNDTLIPFTWLCAGAILGHCEAPRRSATERNPRFLRKDPIIGGTSSGEQPRGLI